MVNAIDLLLVEVGVQFPVELSGRIQVMTKGLFHHQPACPRVLLIEAQFSQSGNNGCIQIRRSGKIVQACTAQALFCRKWGELLGSGGICCQVGDMAAEMR